MRTIETYHISRYGACTLYLAKSSVVVGAVFDRDHQTLQLVVEQDFEEMGVEWRFHCVPTHSPIPDGWRHIHTFTPTGHIMYHLFVDTGGSP